MNQEQQRAKKEAEKRAEQKRKNLYQNQNRLLGNRNPLASPSKPIHYHTFNSNPKIPPNFRNSNPFLVGLDLNKKPKAVKIKPKDTSNEELKTILNDEDFVKELEKSGIDKKALNVIKERLRKEINGDLEKEKNKIPRYEDIED